MTDHGTTEMIPGIYCLFTQNVRQKMVIIHRFDPTRSIAVHERTPIRLCCTAVDLCLSSVGIDNVMLVAPTPGCQQESSSSTFCPFSPTRTSHFTLPRRKGHNHGSLRPFHLLSKNAPLQEGDYSTTHLVTCRMFQHINLNRADLRSSEATYIHLKLTPQGW